MSDKSVADYLQDLLRELNDIEAFTIEGKASFEADTKTQKAVIRCYEVVGEIARRLPSIYRDKYHDIDWRKLIKFRDFLAHNYDRIVMRFLWEAVEDIPNLRAAVETMLRDLEKESNGSDDPTAE